MAVDFKLPTLSQHVAVVGRNGTGKTFAGMWLLSKSRFDVQPFIVIDSKQDELIAGLDRIRELSFKDRLPTEPGLYKISPLPGQEEALDEWLWRVWGHENTGLYVDEGYSIPATSQAWRAVLTQGRSKRLPVTALSQRPSHVSRFIFSEASYFAVFQLNHIDDRKRILEYIPKDKVNMDARLPEYWFNWYDVKQNAAFVMRPVPDGAEIQDTIDRRLTPKRKVA